MWSITPNGPESFLDAKPFVLSFADAIMRPSARKQALNAAKSQAIDNIVASAEANTVMEYRAIGCILLKLTIQIKPTRTTPSQTHVTILSIERAHPLGSGSFGVVLPAHVIDHRNHTMNTEPSYAVKISRQNRSIDRAEIDLMQSVKALKLYHFGMYDLRQYCIMEYIPPCKLGGLPLFDVKPELIKRLNYIVSLCSQLHLLHRKYHTMHLDIKMDNTLLLPEKIELGHKQPGDIWLIDFGLSQRLDIEKIQVTPSRLPMDLTDHYDHARTEISFDGNPNYFAPEIVAHWACIKSDIYMLSGTILELLGERDSMASKYRMKCRGMGDEKTREREAFKLPFDNNIAELGEALGVNLRSVALTFITLMGKLIAHERPAIEFVLRFFTTLSLLYSHGDRMTILDQEQSLAILIFLATQRDYFRKKPLLDKVDLILAAKLNPEVWASIQAEYIRMIDNYRTAQIRR